MQRQGFLARLLYCKKTFVGSDVTAALVGFWETYTVAKISGEEKLQLQKLFENLHVPFSFFPPQVCVEEFCKI